MMRIESCFLTTLPLGEELEVRWGSSWPGISRLGQTIRTRGELERKTFAPSAKYRIPLQLRNKAEPHANESLASFLWRDPNTTPPGPLWCKATVCPNQCLGFIGIFLFSTNSPKPTHRSWHPPSID